MSDQTTLDEPLAERSDFLKPAAMELLDVRLEETVGDEEEDCMGSHSPRFGFFEQSAVLGCLVGIAPGFVQFH